MHEDGPGGGQGDGGTEVDGEEDEGSIVVWVLVAWIVGRRGLEHIDDLMCHGQGDGGPEADAGKGKLSRDAREDSAGVEPWHVHEQNRRADHEEHGRAHGPNAVTGQERVRRRHAAANVCRDHNDGDHRRTREAEEEVNGGPDRRRIGPCEKLVESRVLEDSLEDAGEEERQDEQHGAFQVAQVVRREQAYRRRGEDLEPLLENDQDNEQPPDAGGNVLSRTGPWDDDPSQIERDEERQDAHAAEDAAETVETVKPVAPGQRVSICPGRRRHDVQLVGQYVHQHGQNQGQQRKHGVVAPAPHLVSVGEHASHHGPKDETQGGAQVEEEVSSRPVDESAVVLEKDHGAEMLASDAHASEDASEEQERHVWCESRRDRADEEQQGEQHVDGFEGEYSIELTGGENDGGRSNGWAGEKPLEALNVEVVDDGRNHDRHHAVDAHADEVYHCQCHASGQPPRTSWCSLWEGAVRALQVGGREEISGKLRRRGNGGLIELARISKEDCFIRFIHIGGWVCWELFHRHAPFDHDVVGTGWRRLWASGGWRWGACCESASRRLVCSRRNRGI